MNNYTKRLVISYAVWGGIVVGDRVARSLRRRMITKALKKELENLKREQEKGIIDIEDYVVSPA